MKRESAKNILKFSSIFFIGAIAGGSFQVSGWSINKEVDLLQALSILVSVFIFFYIAIWLDKNKEISKTKKEIMVNKSELIIALIRDAVKLISTGKIETGRATHIFKELYVNYDSLKYFLYKSGEPVETLEVNFKKRYRSARKLATLTPPKGSKDQAKLHIENGCIVYSASRSAEICGELKAIELTLVDEQIRLINL